MLSSTNPHGGSKVNVDVFKKYYILMIYSLSFFKVHLLHFFHVLVRSYILEISTVIYNGNNPSLLQGLCKVKLFIVSYLKLKQAFCVLIGGGFLR